MCQRDRRRIRTLKSGRSPIGFHVHTSTRGRHCRRGPYCRLEYRKLFEHKANVHERWNADRSCGTANVNHAVLGHRTFGTTHYQIPTVHEGPRKNLRCHPLDHVAFANQMTSFFFTSLCGNIYKPVPSTRTPQPLNGLYIPR